MRKTLLIAAASLLPLAAHAHMPWLLPNASVASAVKGKDVIVSIDAAVSEDLFTFERALKLEQLVITGPGGIKLQARDHVIARNHESFDVALPVDGSYRISNFSSSAMGTYRQGEQTQRFRGALEDIPSDAQVTSLSILRTRQQTFVSREVSGKIDFTPEGMGLELLPLDPVTDLSNGDRTRFRLLLDGKPVSDVAITLRRGGNRYRYKMGELTLKSDAKGEFSVQWAEPGAYWMGASVGDRAVQGGTRDKPAQRAAVTATFEVLPR